MESWSTLSTIDVRVEQETSVVRGSTVSFHALNYFVNAPRADRCCGCCCIGPKQILFDQSGIFRPGMNAIMGSTGSGKTTLLDALSGRTEPSNVRGTILLDGQRLPSKFKFLTGYVVQDDVVMGTLTIRENLMFSANLRLPNSLSQKDKRHRVKEIIEELGLTSSADTKVGTQFIRGVSGGERKRTNIGMELIISPNILFLDEPTTGLDSSTASAVMSLLHRLSKGRTVIFSLHQPRFTIFKLIDRLSLLAAGHSVFHGPASQALPFFESLGYVCEQHDNPADFFLDIINGDSTAIHANDRTKNEAKENVVVTINGNSVPVDKEQPVKYSTSTSTVATDSSIPGHSENYVEDSCVELEVQSTAKNRTTSLAEELSANFFASTWAKEINEELAPILASFESANLCGVTETTEHDQYVTSFLTQIAVSIFFGVLIGIIYLQLDNSQAGLQNRNGVLFFIVVHQLFSTLSSIGVFIEERAIFIHECASGFYRVSPYFLSKIICNFMLMHFIPLCFFSTTAYFLIGFQLDVGKFFIYFLTLVLTTLASAGVVFTASVTFHMVAIANLLSVFVFVLMMIFGGLLVNITSLADWLSWLQYFSITRYSLNALSINELDDMIFYDTKVNGSTGSPCYLFAEGSVYLTVQGIAHDTLWDLWKNIMALGIIAIGLLFIAYIQLRRMKKLK